MKKLFIDADIILDLLASREPFYEYSAEIFSLADTGKIKAYTSPVIIANLHYILAKLTGKKEAIKHIQKLLTLLQVLPVDEKIITLALSSNFRDFEDAIQYYTALENNINYLITRNVKDYRRAKISVMTAVDFLTIYQAKL